MQHEYQKKTTYCCPPTATFICSADATVLEPNAIASCKIATIDVQTVSGATSAPTERRNDDRLLTAPDAATIVGSTRDETSTAAQKKKTLAQTNIQDRSSSNCRRPVCPQHIHIRPLVECLSLPYLAARAPHITCMRPTHTHTQTKHRPQRLRRSHDTAPSKGVHTASPTKQKRDCPPNNVCSPSQEYSTATSAKACGDRPTSLPSASPPTHAFLSKIYCHAESMTS
jgi:hypothetical protein